MRFVGVWVGLVVLVMQLGTAHSTSVRNVRRVRVAERELRQMLRFEVTLAPHELAALGSPSAGLVREVLVDAASVVKKGQRLVSIEPVKGGKPISVLAPFDGIVISRSAVLGVYVGEGVPVVTVATTLSSLRAEIEVPETQARMVTIGQNLSLRFEAFPDRLFEATLVTRVPWIDARTRTQHCDAALANPDHALLPGMSGVASLLVAQRTGPAAPTAAVTHEGDRAFVFRIVAGKVTKTPVQLGITDGDFVEVVSGATSDDELVIGAQDGQTL